MQDRKHRGVRCGDFEAQYDTYLVRVRGLSRSTRCTHRLVIHKLLITTFPSGHIRWRDFRFRDVVRFVTSEFQRLPSRATQRVWLMVLRSLLRYLAEEELISAGWDAALPPIANPQHALLPRGPQRRSGARTLEGQPGQGAEGSA
jgi:site-specific recombinase XerD